MIYRRPPYHPRPPYTIRKTFPSSRLDTHRCTHKRIKAKLALQTLFINTYLARSHLHAYIERALTVAWWRTVEHATAVMRHRSATFETRENPWHKRRF